MALVSLIRPRDQPPGNRRLLTDLKTSLHDARFNHFRFIVAYAKAGPFLRLLSHLELWRSQGKTTEAILGIDQQGTSIEALRLALQLLDAVYVTQDSRVTFHPKIYLFAGAAASRAFIGSNNFTVGGTETNFESAVQLELDPSTDATTVAALTQAWDELLPINCPATRRLDASLLAKLVADGDVVQERATRVATVATAGVMGRPKPPRSGLIIKPPSALPPLRAGAKPPKGPSIAKAKTGKPALSTATVPAVGSALAIQIKPHHNGEIFLSVTAVHQYPAFFRWPFTGATTPKKAGNPSYPQLVPDPIVDITVYGAGAAPILSLNAYSLNTIYYATKSEIRITASPLVGLVPEYSVMIMEVSKTPGIDYDITIHTPASGDYSGWLSACNQEMPGGGKAPRKYGWF